MILTNFDRQTGKFKLMVTDILDDDAITMLKKIHEAKGSFTWETLAAERELDWVENNENKGDKIQHQIGIMDSLEGCFLIEKYPICDKTELKDFGYKTTNVGKVILNIREKKV
jgi:hypothetical protein